MQKSTLKGLNVGASVHTLGWASDYFTFLDENAPSGYGGGITAGYGITELFEPYVGFSYTGLGVSDVDVSSFSMSHLDVGLKVNFLGTIHAWRPFIMAGYTYRMATIRGGNLDGNYSDLSVNGHTPHVGGGISYFFSPALSVFVNGSFTINDRNSLTIDGMATTDEPDVTTFRIALGIQFSLQSLMN